MNAPLPSGRYRRSRRTARLTERTEVAREIHDLVAHHVASIALRAAVARDLMPNIDQDEVAAVLDDVHTAATTALADLRKLVTVLRDPRTVDPALPAQFGPGILDPIDLPPALRDSLDRAVGSGLIVSDQIDPTVAGLDAVRALAVLRTVQEGLTNVTKTRRIRGGGRRPSTHFGRVRRNEHYRYRPIVLSVASRSRRQSTRAPARWPRSGSRSSTAVTAALSRSR